MKIKVGEKLPSVEFFTLDDNKAVQKINTSSLFKSQKAILIGVPGAFTKICSAEHLPGYVENFEKAREKGITKIICVSVNDPNVMKAWGDNQNVKNKILMIADPFYKFTKLIGAEIDRSEKGLGIRSNRYTMLVEDEIVKKIREEEDAGTCKISAAENFIKDI
jgi:peroxiredoxin|tara:strand:+ start:647 stop:1135 length:489 start_codon:yes stop_codon:yes gene_type:complete